VLPVFYSEVDMQRRNYLARLWLSYKGWRKYLPLVAAMRAALSISA
jgi:hypothetical protein